MREAANWATSRFFVSDWVKCEEGAYVVRINGTAVDAHGKTLEEYLAETDYDPRLIAVEHNEEIVPKARYREIILQDGDVVEIVCFMGGG